MADIDKIEIGAQINYEIAHFDKKRCIGYIIQGFVNYTDYYEELVFEVTTPTGKTFKNTYWDSYMWDDNFLGYPDNGAKYMPCYRYDPVNPDCDFVLVVDQAVVNTIDGIPLTATAFPEPTYYPTWPGHSWVTGPYYAHGSCGTTGAGVQIFWTVDYPYETQASFQDYYIDYENPGTQIHGESYNYSWTVMVYTGAWTMEGAGTYYCVPSDSPDGLLEFALDYTGINNQNTDDVNSLLAWCFAWNKNKYNGEVTFHHYMINGFPNHDALPIYKETSNEGFMTGSGIVITRGSVVFTDRKIGNGEAALFMVPSNTDRIYSYSSEIQTDITASDDDYDTPLLNFGYAQIPINLANGLPPGSGYVGSGCEVNEGYNATKTTTTTQAIVGQFGIPIDVKYGTHTINCSGGVGTAMVWLLIEGEGFQKFQIDLPDNSVIKIRVGEYTNNVRGLITQQ